MRSSTGSEGFSACGPVKKRRSARFSRFSQLASEGPAREGTGEHIIVV